MALPLPFSSRYRTAAVLLATLGLMVFGGHASPKLTPFVAGPMPQRATGDFDGDGRTDVALIQHGRDGSFIRFTFSGSVAGADLEVPVTGIVEGDIDHDGDLDLIAATPAGEVLIWINDGRGHFTRHEASPHPTVSNQASIAAGPETELVAVVSNAAALELRAVATPFVVVRRQPPTVSNPVRFPRHLQPSLRAPPVVL